MPDLDCPVNHNGRAKQLNAFQHRRDCGRHVPNGYKRNAAMCSHSHTEAAAGRAARWHQSPTQRRTAGRMHKPGKDSMTVPGKQPRMHPLPGQLVSILLLSLGGQAGPLVWIYVTQDYSTSHRGQSRAGNNQYSKHVRPLRAVHGPVLALCGKNTGKYDGSA